MKTQRSVTEKREQPKPLSVPFNEERWEKLLPYERSAYFLAEARLKCEGGTSRDCFQAIDSLHCRAIALANIVWDAGFSESGCGIKGESLARVMEILREDIEVAKVLVDQIPLAAFLSASGKAA